MKVILSTFRLGALLTKTSHLFLPLRSYGKTLQDRPASFIEANPLIFYHPKCPLRAPFVFSQSLSAVVISYPVPVCSGVAPTPFPMLFSDQSVSLFLRKCPPVPTLTYLPLSEDTYIVLQCCFHIHYPPRSGIFLAPRLKSSFMDPFSFLYCHAFLRPSANPSEANCTLSCPS